MRPKRIGLPGTAIFALVLTSPIAAQPAGDSLAGKSVSMIIGFGAGGGYDLWGRTVGRHIGRHLPGAPTVIPQNMPGAGSYAAASYIFNIAMIAIIKAHFEWSVMDNRAAKAIVQKGMETGKEKLEELQDLSITFKDD